MSRHRNLLSQPFLIREAVPGDGHLLATLWRDMFHDSPLYAAVGFDFNTCWVQTCAELGNPNVKTRIALSATGTIIGAAQAVLARRFGPVPVASLDRIFVVPARRRSILGRALLTGVISDARQAGAKLFIAGSATGGEGSRNIGNLFARVGMKPAGINMSMEL